MPVYFITGANGFLGSYLIKALLQQGHAVRALKRRTADLSLLGDYALQVDWHEGDLLDYDVLEVALEGVDYVIHSAAKITFVQEEVAEMMEVNVRGTEYVVNACLQQGVKKLIYVSSISAFGRSRTTELIDEEFGWLDDGENSWYSRSKQYGEREVWRGMEEGLPATIVCPGTIFGGGNWSFPPLSIIQSVHRRLPFYTRGINGFVDVRDCVQIILRLVEEDKVGEKYILVSENKSFKEVMHCIADELNVPRPRFVLHPLLAGLAIAGDYLRTLLTGGRRLLTRETVRMADLQFRYSNEKVCRELHYTFIPFEQTLKDSVHCYLKSVKEGKSFGTF